MAHTPDRKPALTMHQLRETAARISVGESRTKLADELGVALPVLDDALAAITTSVAAAKTKSRIKLDDSADPADTARRCTRVTR